MKTKFAYIAGKGLLLLIGIFAMSACGGGGGASGLAGFWKASEICYDTENEETGLLSRECSKSTDENFYFEVTSGGALMGIEDTKLCQMADANTFNCNGETLNYKIVSQNEVIFKMQSEFDTDNEFKMIRVSESEFKIRQKFVKEKLSQVRESVKYLIGKKLILEKELSYDIVDGAKSEQRETLAADISDFSEYQEVGGAQLKSYNPKILIFIDAKSVLVNDSFVTNYDSEMDDDIAEVTAELTYRNGQLDTDRSDTLGRIEFVNKQVLFISEYSWSEKDEDGKVSEGKWIQTKVYNIE